jgi:allophanate hydrolase subunit 2
MPPSGEPIILGPDSGVTGGYPTVGAVITADLPRVAGLHAGSSIVFAPCTVEEAMIAYMRMLTRMNNATIDISYVQQMTMKHPKASKKK